MREIFSKFLLASSSPICLKIYMQLSFGLQLKVILKPDKQYVLLVSRESGPRFAWKVENPYGTVQR